MNNKHENKTSRKHFQRVKCRLFDVTLSVKCRQKIKSTFIQKIKINIIKSARNIIKSYEKHKHNHKQYWKTYENKQKMSKT